MKTVRKKLLSFIALLMTMLVAPQMANATKIYFEDSSHSQLYIYHWGSSNPSNWNTASTYAQMSKVPGTTDLWVGDVPSNTTGMIFMSGTGNDDYKIKQVEDSNGLNGVYYYTSDGTQTAIPDNMYIMGDIPGGWKESHGADATFKRTNDYTFTLTEIEFTANTSYFRLTKNSNSWNDCYGPSGSNTAISVPANVDFQWNNGTQNNWTIAKGTYDIVLNFLTMKMSVTAHSAPTPDPGTETTYDIYVDVASNTSWTAPDAHIYGDGISTTDVAMSKVYGTIYYCQFKSTVSSGLNVMFRKDSSWSEQTKSAVTLLPSALYKVGTGSAKEKGLTTENSSYTLPVPAVTGTATGDGTQAVSMTVALNFSNATNYSYTVDGGTAQTGTISSNDGTGTANVTLTNPNTMQNKTFTVAVEVENGLGTKTTETFTYTLLGMSPTVAYSEANGSAHNGSSKVITLTPSNMSSSWWHKVVEVLPGNTEVVIADETTHSTADAVDVTIGDTTKALYGKHSRTDGSNIYRYNLYKVYWGLTPGTAEGSATFELRPHRWFIKGAIYGQTWTQHPLNDAEPEFTDANGDGEFELTFTPVLDKVGFQVRETLWNGNDVNLWMDTDKNALEIHKKSPYEGSITLTTTPPEDARTLFQAQANTPVNIEWNPTSKVFSISQTPVLATALKVKIGDNDPVKLNTNTKDEWLYGQQTGRFIWHDGDGPVQLIVEMDNNTTEYYVLNKEGNTVEAETKINTKKADSSSETFTFSGDTYENTVNVATDGYGRPLWLTFSYQSYTLVSLLVSFNADATTPTWHEITNGEEFTVADLLGHDVTGNEKWAFRAYYNVGDRYFYTSGVAADGATLTGSTTAGSFGIDPFIGDVKAKLTLGTHAENTATFNITSKKDYKKNLYIIVEDPAWYVANHSNVHAMSTTDNGRTWSISGLTIPSDKNFVASTCSAPRSGTNTWSDITANGNTMWNKAGNTNYSVPYEGEQPFQAATSGTWKTTEEGDYTVILDFTTMKAEIFIPSGEVADVRLNVGGTDKGSLLDGAVIDLTLAGNEDVYVQVSYADGTTPPTNYYVHDLMTANGTYTVSKNATGAKGFDYDVVSAKVSAQINSHGLPSALVVTNAVPNVYTKTVTNVKDGDTYKYSIFVNDSRGNRTYYTATSAITATGTYPLTAGDSTPATVDITIDGMTTGWVTVTFAEDGYTPVSIKVADPNLRVQTLQLIMRKDNAVKGNFTYEGDGIFTLTTTVDTGEGWWTGEFYLKSNDGTSDKYWTGGFDEQHKLDPGVEEFLHQKGMENNFFSFKHSNIKITVKLDENNMTNVYSLTYEAILGPLTLYLYQNDSNWNNKRATATNNGGVFVFKNIKLDDNKEFLFGKNDATGWGNIGRYNPNDAANKDLPITDCAFGESKNSGVWKTNSNGGTYTITVTFTSDNAGTVTFAKKKPTLPEDVACSDLNVMPRVVREAGGEWDAWTNDMPAIYVIGDYLNNNRTVPDWEMMRIDNNHYRMQSVTLRGNNGTNAHRTLKAKVYYKNQATAEEVTITETINEVTLESKTEISNYQAGRLFNLYMSRDDEESPWEFTWEHVSNLPPYIGIVGKDLTQIEVGATPNGKSTDDGWQEGFILYDQNQKPLRDLDNNYIYSTQWPPRYPIYFTSEDANGDVIELTSTQLTFKPDAEVKTGAEWEKALGAVANSAQDDSNLKDDYLQVDGMGLDLVDNVTYARYTVKGVWYRGGAKFWTGWGSQTRDNYGNAQWDNHMNWGYDNHGDKNTNDKEGFVVTPGKTEDVTLDYSNFFFGTTEKTGSTTTYTPVPTYYKTMELFVPVLPDEDNQLDRGKYADTRLYAVRALGAMTITAKATNDFCGEMTINFGSLNSDEVTKAVVYRYLASTDFDAPEEEWQPVGTALSHASQTIELTAGQIATLNTDKRLVIKDAELNNGRYIYRLVYKIQDAGGKLHEDAVLSTTFSIYRPSEYKPTVIPMQLMELTDEGKALVAGAEQSVTLNGGNLQATVDGAVRTFTFITLSNTGNYYLVSADSYIKNIKASTGGAVRRDPTKFNYTADYYVLAFDAYDYASDMKKAIANGEIVSYDRPSVWIVNGESIRESDFVDANLAQRTATENSKILYGRYFHRNGNLDQVTYSAAMKHTEYIDVEGEPIPSPSAAIDDTDNTVPVVPRPYGLNYHYSYVGQEGEPQPNVHTNEFGTFDDDVEYLKFSVPSLLKNSDEEGYMLDLYMPIADAAYYVKRRMDVEITFNRPNVTNAIFDYYDIYYHIILLSNFGQEGDMSGDPDQDFNHQADGWYVDTDESTSPGIYHVKFTNVHPSLDIYPAFYLPEVRYVPNANEGGGSNQNRSDKTATVIPLVPDYVMGTSGESQTVSGIKGLRLGQRPAESDPEKLDWMYGGHEEFDDQDGITMEGKKVGPAGEDPTTNDVSLKTFFYYLEVMNSKGDYAAYPYVIRHDSDHRATGDYLHDGVCIWNDCDPLIGAMIAKGFTKNMIGDTPEAPDFIITPLYLFERDPQVEGTSGQTVTDLTQATPPTLSKAVQRKAKGTQHDYGLTEDGEITSSAASQYSRLPDVDVIPAASKVADLSERYVTLSSAEPIVTNATNDGGLVTGVEDILYGSEMWDGEPVYYNLQGVRIVNPERGQIYIVRRGSTATKEVIK